MSVDMTLEPWRRLIRLAPPGTNTQDLQFAADRYALTGDLYAAAADLWEEKAMGIDVTTEDSSADTPTNVASVSQDGISVTYASDALSGNGLSARIASVAQMMAKARYFRSKAKAKTVMFHDGDYNPWIPGNRGDDEIIIVVDDV